MYVLDEMATPPLARQAKRRPLDEFERLGLDALRRGEELVWTREASTRMFGEICAKAVCLHCHANAKEGDLLGAFTYYLKVPVDRLNIRELDGERLLEPDPVTKLIRDRLEDKIDLRFEKTSLEDVFKLIKSATRRGPNDRGIPIYVDPMGLVEAEKTLATPVSFTAKGEPLKSSLERLLKSISLTYSVKDGYPDGHIAMNRDRLWDAIDSAHELKPAAASIDARGGRGAVARCVERVSQLYERGADLVRIGAYVRYWQCWVRRGLRGLGLDLAVRAVESVGRLLDRVLWPHWPLPPFRLALPERYQHQAERTADACQCPG